MKKFANVLMLLAVAMVITVSNAQALTFGSVETLSPYIKFVADTKYNSCSMPVAKPWKANLAELAILNQGLREPYKGRTGVAEAEYMRSILQGLPQEFWGGYVDWRNPEYAVRVYRYLVETMGFDPNAVGIMMSQDGFGVDSYKPRNFRLYSPAIKVGNSVIVFLDREYLDAVGVPPEAMHHSQFTGMNPAVQAKNLMVYSPWPKETPTKVSMTITTDSTNCGCDNHRGKGNDHCDNGRQTIDDRGNSNHQ